MAVQIQNQCEICRITREYVKSLQYPTLAKAQGLYYLVTGIWPILSIRTFLMVTGPKTDIWLVKTIGLLLIVIGAVLLTAAIRRKVAPEVLILATGSAAAIAVIELIYVSNATISAIYLLDAVLEMGLLFLWACCYRTETRR